jgi:hypothetical protein
LNSIALFKLYPGNPLAVKVSTVFASLVHKKDLSVVELDDEMLARDGRVSEDAIRRLGPAKGYLAFLEPDELPASRS